MKRTGVDWGRVRSRLLSGEQALEEAANGSPERIDTVYRQRAARLAKGQGDQTRQFDGVRVLVFRLGPERYAVEVKDVAEVFPLERCAPVPGSLPLFAGVINLRGELRTMVDLTRLLALPDGIGPDSGFVLLLRRRGQEIGFKVDRIEELCEISREELSQPLQGKYVIGVMPGPLTLLGVDAVLAEVFSKEGV